MTRGEIEFLNVLGELWVDRNNRWVVWDHERTFWVYRRWATSSGSKMKKYGSYCVLCSQFPTSGKEIFESDDLHDAQSAVLKHIIEFHCE